MDGAADPVLIWNREEKKWWMLYTQRRANTAGKKNTNLTIVPGGHATYRYRVLILNGTANAETIEQQFAAFAQQGS